MDLEEYFKMEKPYTDLLNTRYLKDQKTYDQSGVFEMTLKEYSGWLVENFIVVREETSKVDPEAVVVKQTKIEEDGIDWDEMLFNGLQIIILNKK